MTLEFINNKLKNEYPFNKRVMQYHLDKIKSLPKNQWIAPTNNKSDDYSFLDNLYSLNLCERKTTPSWNNGSFVGHKVEFRINTTPDKKRKQKI